MNVFIIFIVALFMAGYYFLDAPSVLLKSDSRSETVEISELKSVISCVLRAHSDALRQDESAALSQKATFKAELPCAARYGVATRKLCADDKRITASCAPDRVGKSVSNYVITETSVTAGNGKILEILNEDYTQAASLGVISVGQDKTPYLLSASGARREISKTISKEADFKPGRLVYITQYAVDWKKAPAEAKKIEKAKCNANETPVFRQNKWTCVQTNIAPTCSGDFIWDPEQSACVPDASKRRLCRSNQTAVMVDGMWDCVDPETARECPAGLTARLNYGTMEWECSPAVDLSETKVKKCDKIYDRAIGGGSTPLRLSLISCNDCETMIVHDDCTAECVPDAAAIAKRSCYAGACENFYFGFPNARYVANAKKNLSVLSHVEIPLDDAHSKNRKFNCTECPLGIDEVASAPPYVIICR